MSLLREELNLPDFKASPPDADSVAEGRIEIPSHYSRSGFASERREIVSAAWLVERMCLLTERRDLSETDVLDMGCGVKFTKLFLNHGTPIRRYVGIDVCAEMIDFLREQVADPRFEYHHVNLKNDKYNPGGEPFTRDAELPVGDSTFDLICLMSVFTHLSPPDYRTMLQVLRRYVRPDGRLFFTLYVNRLTAGGHGLIDRWVASIDHMRDELDAQRTARVAAGLPEYEPFVDLYPNSPLTWAVYSEAYARELIEGTGWRVVSLSDPDVYVQHHFVCAPD